MNTAQHGRRIRLSAGALAVLLALVGAAFLGIGIHAQEHAPQPPASAAIPYSTTATHSTSPTPSAATPGPRSAGAVTGPVLNASIPTRLDIPAIGVSSTLIELGLNPDHSVQVPPQGRDSRAGWYRYSPTPGALGPAVLLGHVDSVQYGPGVFFKLGALRPGTLLTVTRADHTAAVFRVDRVVSYPKDRFPTLEVYGNTDHAALRLITCGGAFNLSSHSYENNIVAYASLVSSHAA
ncbi:class F sortase [Nostocoides sp. HKS02]|uniref:class F sortase n=1 Tax=Nostocoides sp. HKS02 TaxID=1813880 RepID=UPI0012B48776|nr:class F sortase [Tetrasphaera sp. HKS02]QGN59065.1 class F sortase [Tetrasphaera sp. HKS02]